MPDCMVSMHSRASGQAVAVKFTRNDRASLTDWILKQFE
jgi:hypothetical protein